MPPPGFSGGDAATLQAFFLLDFLTMTLADLKHARGLRENVKFRVFLFHPNDGVSAVARVRQRVIPPHVQMRELHEAADARRTAGVPEPR